MPDTPAPATARTEPPAGTPYGDADVLVVGAGPAGLMLACELALGRVRTVLLERHPAPPGFCRGFNLNARSLELLDRRGLADRFLAEGPTVPTTAFVGAAQLNLAAMRSEHPTYWASPRPGWRSSSPSAPRTWACGSCAVTA